MKNIFELIYESTQKKRSVDECDGGAGAAVAGGGEGGGISGGDMSPGGPMGPGSGITSDSVFGRFDPEKGCLGKKDFHIPFPVGKLMRRFPVAKSCCNGGGSLKKRKDKNGKTRTVKNPYAKGLKTIVAEADVFQYEGEAARQFYNVIAPQQADRIYNDVLYYNDTYKLAWLIKKDGILHMYKPMCRQTDGGVWTIYATHLSPEGTVEFDYKGGRYQNEKLALDAVYKAAESHRRQLEEALKGLDERCKDEDVVIVYGIKPKRLRWLLNNSKHDVDNFCPDYVRKAIRSNPTAVGAFSRYDRDNALALMTVIEGYGPGTYLHEMTGFVRGGGKQLVDAVISRYRAVWGQVAQVQEDGNGKCLGTNQDLLNKFYMKIPALKFYSVENSVFDGAEATFFYTGIADAEFAKFCEDSFGKTGLNESSAGFERIDDIVAFLDGKNLEWERVVKFQRVNARQSAGGEKIRTVGSDGNVETERTTSAGDWVVNNVETPDNVWIIGDATFRKKYEQDGDGVYKPKGGAMLAVPVASCCAAGVEFAPPKWGGDVIRIQNDGYFMKDLSDGTDIYAVSKADFDSTYRPEGRLDEQRFSPKDIMNWEAHGRDPRYFPSARKISPNMHALTAELKQKFRGQFKDVRLTDLGGTWKAEFSVENLQSPTRGQRRVKEVVPRIDDIVRLLRIRGIETNQYDISAVPASLNESAPVVSDQTIDSFGASYYCIFGDPDFRTKVDEIRNSEKYRQMGRSAIQAGLDAAQEDGDKQINEFVLPAVAAYPLVAPAVKIVAGMVAAWLASKVATDVVVSATKTDATAVAQTAAQTTAEAVAETPVADLGTVVVEAPRIPDQQGGGFWKWFLSTSIGGLFGAAGSFIAALFGAGAAAAQTITIGLASAVACGCAALARHLVPVMVSWVKKLRISGVIAYADFESDGDGYRLAYSIRDNKWHMFLRGSRLLNRRANPSASEIQQVMQTEFFKRFRNRCSEILHEYLDDPVNVTVLTTLVSQNRDELKYADELIENRESILARFDAPTFVSEDEN